MTVANLHLRPVVALLARLRTGVAITSGYLTDDEPAAQNWRRSRRLALDGWAADVFVPGRVDGTAVAAAD